MISWVLFAESASAKTVPFGTKWFPFANVDLYKRFGDITKAVSIFSAANITHILWWSVLRIWSEEDIETKAGTDYAQKTPLFEEIHRGEVFLNQCIAARSSQTTANLCLSPSTTPPSYATCVFAYCKAICTFHLPRRAAILMCHLKVSRQLNVWTSPYQIYVALQHFDSLPSDQGIAIAARLKRAEAPCMERRIGLGQVGIDALTTAILLLQVELIMRFDLVAGLSGMGPLGQLVPFFVGVGSLCLLLFGMAREKIENDRGENKEAVKGKGSGEICMEYKMMMAYKEWKQRFSLDEKPRNGND